MKKINNEKGFTIIELLTSFSLALVVMVFLFNIVLLLRDNYTYNSTKSSLMVEQSLLSSELNADFVGDVVEKIVSCGTDCYDVTVNINNVSKIKRLEVNFTEQTIRYGTYKYTLAETETIESFTVCKNETNASANMNSYLIIDIPITSKVMVDVSLGVKVVYPYFDEYASFSEINGC